MKLRLLRPRDLAIALRELARRDPKEAEDYLDTHQEQWGALVDADPHDAADILEAIDEEAAADLISSLEAGLAAEIIEEMQDEAAADVLEELAPDAAAAMLAEMPADEAADVVAALEPEAREALLEALPGEYLARVERLLAYAPDSAGGLMSTNVATLPSGITTGEAIEALRRLHETYEDLSYVYVVDDAQRLVGVVSFRELVFARPGQGLDQVMVEHPVAVRPDTDREEVADIIQRYGYFSLPVVDERRALLGMIGVDDVIEAVQQEATEDIAAMVGAGPDETLYTPVRRSMRERLPWILVNMTLAFLVAAAVSMFEPVIERLAVLAAYMPVVATLGGNSGNQSQAVVIRAMAVQSVPPHLVRRVIARQATVGLANGLAVGVVSGGIAAAATGSIRIGAVIGAAAATNMAVGSLAGTGIPILLDRLGQDPALASNIFLTLVTDMMGFAGFLGIATLLL
ncbi:MAG: magnesium transporter [Actinobacteria bacterium]|nr:magnesium transporter [Actinomycetota bacterium]